MSSDYQIKLDAQAVIHGALKSLKGSAYVKQPINRVSITQYKQLSRLQIDQGVVALVLECNLTGGSVGDVDLYKLVRCYLHNEDARIAINEIVNRPQQ